jgi:hypothetical protein
MSKKLVISALACVVFASTFLSASESKKAGLVRPDIPGQVADALSQGLAMQGVEVYRNGYSLTIYTKKGTVVDVELPSTLDALKKGEFTAYRNGRPVTSLEKKNDFDLPECLFVATNIFALQTDICINIKDNDLNLYCLVEAAAQLPLNTLKCTFID